MHNDVLWDLEEKYQTCGWRVNLCHHSVIYQVIWKMVELFWNVQLPFSIFSNLQVYIFPSTGVGSEDKSDVDYVYKKVIKHKIYIKVMFNLLFAKKNHSKVISFLQLWEGEDAGVGLTDPLGISFSNSSFRRRNPISGGMGRFLDNSGIYADDIVEGMMVKVMMV